jgi:hypothetical protein
VGDVDERAVRLLLASDEPGIRYRTRTELLDEDPATPELQDLRSSIADGPKCYALLQFQDVDPYEKWFGAFWRLVSLVELGLPPGNKSADGACDFVLESWTSDESIKKPYVVDGLVREHAAVFGIAVAFASKLGFATDPRTVLLAESLCAWQWPDGGWNCDAHAKRRSSFHESLGTAWGLHEYFRKRDEPRALEAVKRAAELFLSHRLFRRLSSGEVIDPLFLVFHWPPYWHYDVLQALRVLGPIDGVLNDERAAEAFDLIESRRLPNGCWQEGGRWWRGPSSTASSHREDLVHGPVGEGGAREGVDWGKTADELITFNALTARKLRSRVE